MKLYICDFIDPSVNELDYFVVEASDEDEAKRKAIEELKSLCIPKRYFIKIEEAI